MEPSIYTYGLEGDNRPTEQGGCEEMNVCGIPAYTVSQKDGVWYAHMVGYSYIPVFGSFEKSRKKALEWAAASMGLSYEEYMEVRKKYGIK